MEIAFNKKSLRKLCEDENLARWSLGAIVANKLKARLADLKAARCIDDVRAGTPRIIPGRRNSRVQINLTEGYRIRLVVNHNIFPTVSGGSGLVDWSNVSRIKIVAIERTNVQKKRV